MPHRRPRKKGSFDSHFDELVELFPAHEAHDHRPSERTPEMQEKIDIHARLFERAWAMHDR